MYLLELARPNLIESNASNKYRLLIKTFADLLKNALPFGGYFIEIHSPSELSSHLGKLPDPL